MENRRYNNNNPNDYYSNPNKSTSFMRSNTENNQQTFQSSNYRNMGPYGMKFGEEEIFRQREINQYRKDLDYLTSLKRPYGDMTQKEWEEYQRKINYMNDRYAYGEMDRKNFLRGMVKGYEDESIRRKQEEDLRKKKELEEERKRLAHLDLTDKEKQMADLRREKEIQNAKDNLALINQRRSLLNMQKPDNEKNYIEFGNENDYKDRVKGLNDKIYDNLQNLNGLNGNSINPDAFKAKNDYEFNKIMAEEKAKLRNKKDMNDNYYNNGIEEEKELDRLKHEEKLRNQRLYKEYLDNQNEIDHLNKLNQSNEDMRPQLIMPAYFYPNRPVPLHKKARDSLLFAKNQKDIFDQDMNKFFRYDSQHSTLIDYERSGGYLGDSKLRHNPITCPVNDYYYNKYVNNMKKATEIPPGNDVFNHENSKGNNFNVGRYNPNTQSYNINNNMNNNNLNNNNMNNENFNNGNFNNGNFNNGNYNDNFNNGNGNFGNNGNYDFNNGNMSQRKILSANGQRIMN